MGKILPILLALVGLGGGIGAGIALRPDPAEMVSINPCGDENASVVAMHEEVVEKDLGVLDYVKLNNQFVIPVVQDAMVSSLVVMSISLEVSTGGQEIIYEREPKLRDAFLQVLFDHANSGGFNGTFTNGRNMTILRDALQKVAIQVLGNVVTEVLIVDLVRQDT